VPGTHNFVFTGPPVWNSLPANLCSASVSLQTFTRRLKTYLFEVPRVQLRMCIILHNGNGHFIILMATSSSSSSKTKRLSWCLVRKLQGHVTKSKKNNCEIRRV